MSSSTVVEPAAYGYRRQNRQDFSGVLDAFADVDAFVDEVLAELVAMEGTKPRRPGPKRGLTGAALRKAIMAESTRTRGSAPGDWQGIGGESPLR